MDSAVTWFMILLCGSAGALGVGFRLGRTRPILARGIAVGAVAANLLMILLMRAGILHAYLPDELVVHTEGVVGIPLAMVVLGILWHHCRIPRERVLVSSGIFTAAVLFLHGAGWMVQVTPAEALASTPTTSDVYQSTEFTCVPASCATALTRMGFSASEADMAERTRARPGSGSTIGRALRAMNDVLEGTPYSAHLDRPTYGDLLRSADPVLVTMSNGPVARSTHMMVVLDTHDRWVEVFDPMVGPYAMSREEFMDEFTGAAIVIRSTRMASR